MRLCADGACQYHLPQIKDGSDYRWERAALEEEALAAGTDG
jgi:hypothetical protein